MKNVQHDLLAGELVPYVLYIPITIMQNEFEDIIKNGAKNF